jgi:hypothetical protein
MDYFALQIKLNKSAAEQVGAARYRPPVCSDAGTAAEISRRRRPTRAKVLTPPSTGETFTAADERWYQSSRKSYLTVHIVSLENRDRVFFFDDLKNSYSTLIGEGSEFLGVNHKTPFHAFPEDYLAACDRRRRSEPPTLNECQGDVSAPG